MGLRFFRRAGFVCSGIGPRAGAGLWAAWVLGAAAMVPAVFAQAPGAVAPACAPCSRTLASFTAIEADLAEAYDRVRPAVVAVEYSSGFGSGVVVSEEGHVLTAGHVLGAPGDRVEILFPDGARAEAVTLGKHGSSDMGMLKLIPAGPYAYAEPGDSGALVRRQMCFGMGHPGGFDAARGPVLRFGWIERLGDTWISSASVIMPGDSGGPLFDMEGRVIGIQSHIEADESVNLSTAIDAFSASWDDLVSGRVWGRSVWGMEPASEDDPGWLRVRPVPEDLASRRDIFRRSPRRVIASACAPVQEAVSGSVVRLWSMRPDGSESGGVFGAVVGVGVDGALVLTKASELGAEAGVDTLRSELPCGSEVAAEILATELNTDTALVRLPAVSVPSGLSQVRWATGLPAPGDIVLVPGFGATRPVRSLGVVGAAPSPVALASQAFVGIGFGRSVRGPGVRIGSVFPGTPAAGTELVAGDIVRQIDGTPVRGHRAFVREITARRPGARVSFLVERADGSEIDVELVLTDRESVGMRQGARHVADAIDLSRIRGGYECAFRHDALVSPKECGGPLVDLDGATVGITVSRLDRAGSLAIPASAAREALTRLCSLAGVDRPTDETAPSGGAQ